MYNLHIKEMWYNIHMEHIVSFSGGKDSTAMLLLMIEKEMPIDRVIFIDTTKEFPAVYENIEKIKKIIPIETIAIDYDYWFSEHIKTRGKNKGQKGYGWPDFRNRWCTALKRDTFVRNIGKDTIEYHGIAYDERHRTQNNKGKRTIKYPLVDWEITEQQALQYCYSKGYDWNGLYEHFARLSCYCRPLSRIGELKHVHNNMPELWANIQHMDKLSKRDFRADYTLDELEGKFSSDQLPLF